MNKKCSCDHLPSITKKNGICHKVRLYKCMLYSHQFRGRTCLSKDKVWKTSHGEKQTIRELYVRFGVSESTIKRLLRDVSIERKSSVDQGNVIINIDATYKKLSETEPLFSALQRLSFYIS